MRKKKKTVKKRKQYRISTRGKIIIVAAAAVMFLCTFSVFYVVLGSYDGLGLAHRLPENDYQMANLYQEDGLLHYEDENYRSVNGIDVSYYQKTINWEKVAADGIDFAIIRLGYRGSEEGRLHTDSRFKENLKGAKKAGLDVGVYFFSQANTVEEAVKEAKYVIRRIRGRGVNYPVVFDMEPVSENDRISGLTAEEKTRIADAFCQIIERNGHTAMIYGNPHWLTNHLQLEYLTDYPLWLAHYTDSTDYPYRFQMWQYTDSGRVDGISGKVDMNLLFVEKEKYGNL